MIRDVGDIVALKLTVTPSAGDTTAALVVTGPDGTTETLSPTPNGDRSEWTAPLLVDEPGEWLVRWTVTGTGGGAEWYRVQVRPDPSGPRGRVYATTADLANHTGDLAPAGSRVLLVRASRIVDALLVGAIYKTDADHKPTEQCLIDAFRDAVCEQVIWWRAIGDEQGTGAGSSWDQVSIGSVRLSRGIPGGSGGQGAGSGQTAAPGAVRALHEAGLLPVAPMVIG